MGTTAEAATPGCLFRPLPIFRVEFTPAAVTMTSLLRPRKRSSPVGLLLGQVAGGQPLIAATCKLRPASRA